MMRIKSTLECDVNGRKRDDKYVDEVEKEEGGEGGKEEEKNKCYGNKLEEWQQIKDGCIHRETLVIHSRIYQHTVYLYQSIWH